MTGLVRSVLLAIGWAEARAWWWVTARWWAWLPLLLAAVAVAGLGVRGACRWCRRMPATGRHRAHTAVSGHGRTSSGPRLWAAGLLLCIALLTGADTRPETSGQTGEPT